MSWDLDSIYEPIEITINKKLYKIVMISPETMIECRKISDEHPDDYYTSVVKQFCMITGEKEEVARKIDLRKIAKSLRIITNSFLEDIDEKKE